MRRLAFVDSVAMSLEATEARIFFKQGEPINLNALAKAVVHAGFSVRFIKLQFDFSDIPVDKDGLFVFQGQPFQWLDFNHQIKREVALRLVDENFLPKKEGAEWRKKFGQRDAASNQQVLHVVQRG